MTQVPEPPEHSDEVEAPTYTGPITVLPGISAGAITKGVLAPEIKRTGPHHAGAAGSHLAMTIEQPS